MFLGSWQRPHSGLPVDSRPTHGNFSTVAIVPVSDDVPLVPFTYELYHALRNIGKGSFMINCIRM